MSDSKVSTVPNRLLEGLSKLGGSIVGLSAFAYIAGIVKLKSMYASIGAAWIAEFVTTQDIVKAGLDPLVMVGVTCAATYYILASRSLVVIKLLTFFVLSLFLILTIYTPSSLFAKEWSVIFNVSEFTACFLYIVSGFLVSCSVFKMVEDGGFYKLPAAAFMIGALLSLYVTPVYIGKVWASSVVSGKAKLPRAVGDQYQLGTCYLLGNVNSKYLIGCVVSEKLKRVQLVDVGKDVAFE